MPREEDKPIVEAAKSVLMSHFPQMTEAVAHRFIITAAMRDRATMGIVAQRIIDKIGHENG